MLKDEIERVLENLLGERELLIDPKGAKKEISQALSQILELTTKTELNEKEVLKYLDVTYELLRRDKMIVNKICSHFSKPQTEPNIPEKSPTCVDLNYKCTTAKIAEQIGIKLWQAMVMMKYADFSKPEIKYPEKEEGIVALLDKKGKRYYKVKDLLKAFWNECIDNMIALNKEEK